MEFCGTMFAPDGHTHTNLVGKFDLQLDEYDPFVDQLIKAKIPKHMILHYLCNLLLPRINYGPFLESGDHKDEYNRI